MATSTVAYLGNLRTSMQHLKSGVVVDTDAPTDNQGQGANFSPTDLMSTSLASCMITIMGITANAYGFDLGPVQATVTKHMAANPRRVSKIQVELDFPERTFSEKEKQLLKTAALNCPVAKSIHPEIEQEINFRFAL
jgi:uncharacterized OsmC-like protein